MNTTPGPTRRHHQGFTLVELLVVLIIASILLGVIFPVIGRIARSSRIETGTNVVNAAVTTARAAARFKQWDLDPPLELAEYSGTAILVTPNGEMRLVDNVAYAVDGSSPPKPLEPSRNGYTDISGRDFIPIPRGVGIVGITRGGSFGSGRVNLLTPPFAIRFNPRGNLIAGTTEESRLVFYDGNYNDKYVVSSTRTAPSGGVTPYNPDRWDPASSTYVSTYNQTSSTGFSTVSRRHTLPFEKIETVVGVLVFDKDAFRKAVPQGFASSTTSGDAGRLNDAATTWLMATTGSPAKLANARAIFFNRYSGVVMKE